MTNPLVPVFWTDEKDFSVKRIRELAAKLLEQEGVCKTFLSGELLDDDAKSGCIHLRRGKEKNTPGNARAVLLIVPNHPAVLMLTQVSKDWTEDLISVLHQVGLHETPELDEYFQDL
jgi:hypothetical protein